jgi:hypothetical protein
MTCRDVSVENYRFSRDVGTLCFVSLRVSFSRVDILTRTDKLTGASETPSNYSNKETRLFWITVLPTDRVNALGYADGTDRQTDRNTDTLLSLQ